MSFMTVESQGIGRSGMSQEANGSAIRQRLTSLLGELEGSRSQWDGVSGVAFQNAKNLLLEQFGGLTRSQGEIARGLGDSQRHVTTGDTTSGDVVDAAGGAIAAVNTVTPVG